MNDKEQEFLSRLRETFRAEAAEHLEALSRGLREWESGVTAQREEELVESLFRETHSLKGAARSVDLLDTEALCQPLESVFAAFKRRELTVSPDLLDLFHRTLDALAVLTTDFDAHAHVAEIELARLLEAAVTGELAATSQSAAAPQAKSKAQPAKEKSAKQERTSGAAETVRVPTAKLFSVLWQAEELLQVKLSAQQRLANWSELTEKEGLSKAWVTRLNKIHQASEKDVRILGRLVEEHIETAKQLLMLPVSTLSEGFPKLVRDLARDQGKDVDLIIQGDDKDIDKRLLEELKDPLIHLLRNAVHHGAEDPGTRKSKSKSPKATIRLEFVVLDDRHWEVVVADDGPGLDRQRIASQAVALGGITREAADLLTDDQKADLVFWSGVSTSPVTDLAGRGLGLAIVREKAERLGGSVAVRSAPGLGTTFILRLPLTLSTLRGVMVQVSGQAFLIPSLSVERVKKTSQQEIGYAGDRPVFPFQGRSIPLLHLASVLGLERTPDASPTAPVYVAILLHSDRYAAFQVDEIVGEQLVLVKGLELPLRRVRNVAGATILGSGKVVPVLNVSDLLDFSHRIPAPPVSVTAQSATTATILLADDSITSRALFKTLLEAAGHRVTSAVDGADAWEKLQSGDFDLVVSDVDMPRMTGLELTMRIRRDAKQKTKPVILITSMDAPEDKERGMTAGANAYLVKSRFDQKTLLETVRRLV